MGTVGLELLALPSGWSQEDEDKWNEAIEEIVNQLQSGEGIFKNGKGETALKMTALIGVATKSTLIMND